MKLISSWSFEPYLSKEYGRAWSEEVYMWACARGSIESFSDNFNQKVLMYTDSIGAEIFPMLSDKVECLNVFDDLHKTNDVHLSMFNYAKFHTYRAQIEPYLHFDLDLILHSKIPESFFETSISFEKEHIPNFSTDMKRAYNVSRFKDIFEFPECYHGKNDPDEYMCPNLGVLYMSDMNFNKLYCDQLFFWPDKYKQLMGTKNEYGELLTAAVTEQQPLGLLIHDHKKKYSVLDGCADFVHFQSWILKGQLGPKKVLDKWINDDVLLVVERVEKLKGEMSGF